MRRAIEEFLFEGRWRRDEYAWRVWQGLEPLLPTAYPPAWQSVSMAGRVVRIYQRAHRGSKAVVDFGPLGSQDTWWPSMRPPVGKWVVVSVRLWLPPGTHSGRHVLWVDHWESWAPGDVHRRAMRHERRVAKGRFHGSAGQKDNAPAL
jgi:hypothetical protein